MSLVRKTEEYGEELILALHGPYEVRVPLRDGKVMADYVRVIEMFGDEEKEIAYWNLHELTAESTYSDMDSKTALNAMLSAIELVRTGKYKREVL